VRGYPTDSSVRWPARRVQSSIIAQADTLYSYALLTASKTRASAAMSIEDRNVELVVPAPFVSSGQVQAVSAVRVGRGSY
jgi:hypothetical protein